MSCSRRDSFDEAPADFRQVAESSLSRACTLDADLNLLTESDDETASEVSHATGSRPLMYNWSLRPTAANDFLLRESFRRILESSAVATCDEERLVMYDAADETEVRQVLGIFRKRLDARRNTKPKKPDTQKLVCTPFDPKAFNFSKITNERERILRLQLSVGRYDVLTNKFPLFPKHMLLVCDALVPQQMRANHLQALTELLQATTFCAYFNSWCASASVNHFHCHLIDEFPPVTSYKLVAGPIVGMMAKPDGTPLPGFRCYTPQGFPGCCYVYPTSALVHVDAVVRAMQADNQPHNLLFTPRYVYIFPKPLERPNRSFELYPETVGGPELIGSFTTYTEDAYERLSSLEVDELVRINTAPLPSRLLQRGCAKGAAIDDAAVFSAATTTRGATHFTPAISLSHTVDFLPSRSMIGTMRPATSMGNLHDLRLSDMRIQRDLSANSLLEKLSSLPVSA